MINPTDIAGLASATAVITAAFMQIPGMARLAKPRLALLAGIVVIVALIPLGDMSSAAYVRGMVGDLSITTLVLLLLSILRPLFGWRSPNPRTRIALWILIAFAALALYPMALGMGPFDPYRSGYGNPWFIGALLLVALAAWFWRLPLIALCIAFAMLAWVVGWYESNNLWDYLIDPVASVYAVWAIMFYGVKALLKLRRDQLSWRPSGVQTDGGKPD
ncbi:MAG: hypothetical protein PHG47_00895 [Sulfuricella sp.]|nr:hypothetical protein [Sulfuricella sp.]